MDNTPSQANPDETAAPSLLPLVRLDFYDSAVILSRYHEGAPPAVTAYPVSMTDVAAACAQLAVSTGLLPPETLFWRSQGNVVSLAVFVPARPWLVQAGEERLLVPLPAFIFSGRERQYSVYAVKERPVDGRALLYHFPAPNVHSDGRICAGSAPFPDCRPESIYDALRLFLEGSRFNNDLSTNKCRAFPNNVGELWRKLDGKRKFPLKELVPMQQQLRELL
jgi:PRTRC genetic system protein B